MWEDIVLINYATANEPTISSAGIGLYVYIVNTRLDIASCFALEQYVQREFIVISMNMIMLSFCA